jgi:hypothetical protein
VQDRGSTWRADGSVRRRQPVYVPPLTPCITNHLHSLPTVESTRQPISHQSLVFNTSSPSAKTLPPRSILALSVDSSEAHPALVSFHGRDCPRWTISLWGGEEANVYVLRAHEREVVQGL